MQPKTVVNELVFTQHVYSLTQEEFVQILVIMLINDLEK